MQKTRFEIDCENFDYFFAQQLPFITPQAKEEIPKDVTFKLFRRGGEFNPKNTSKLGFIAKLFILWRCLRKRWYLVIEDDKEGLSIEQFIKWHEDSRKLNVGLPVAEGYVTYGGFVLGSKEVCDTFSYLNYLGGSSAYNYLIKSKNTVKNKTAEGNREKEYITNFLVNYDSHKKNIVANFGLTIPEFYVLLVLYGGKEILSSWIYKEKFKRAYQSTPSKIKLAFRTLQSRGYIEKTGVIKGVKLHITPLGKDVLNRILDKYILNC